MATVNTKHSSTPSHTTKNPHTKAQSLLIKNSSLLIKKNYKACQIKAIWRDKINIESDLEWHILEFVDRECKTIMISMLRALIKKNRQHVKTGG